MLAVGLVAIGIWIFAVSGLWILPVILFARLFSSWWGLLIVLISLKAMGII